MKRTKEQLLVELGLAQGNIATYSEMAERLVKRRRELEDELINSQQRCASLAVLLDREQEYRRAAEEAATGLTRRNRILVHEAQFSSLTSPVIARLTKLLNNPVTVCPKRGDIAMAPSNGKSGVRPCPTCYEKDGWPWPNEIKHFRDKDGNFTGVRYTSPVPTPEDEE